MQKIASFDKSTLSALREELNKVLQSFGVDLGVEFSVGNMRFSPAEVKIDIQAKIGGAVTAEDKIIEREIVRLNLKRNSARGDTLIGYKRANYKKPYIYMAKDGKTYKCDEAFVKMLFGA